LESKNQEIFDSMTDYPTIFSITTDELDLNALVEQITLPSTGAAAIFTGMVRGVTSRDNPHETVYLEYEAYKPMAEAKMKQVADEIRAQWPTVEGIAIVQRIGRLYPRTPTVLIACSSPHRDTGVFDAARYGIDRLKEIVPVWKKEVGPRGEEWVEGDYDPRAGE
jgi:molybdopterin synthase catalytic subunit